MQRDFFGNKTNYRVKSLHLHKIFCRSTSCITYFSVSKTFKISNCYKNEDAQNNTR